MMSDGEKPAGLDWCFPPPARIRVQDPAWAMDLWCGPRELARERFRALFALVGEGVQLALEVDGEIVAALTKRDDAADFYAAIRNPL